MISYRVLRSSVAYISIGDWHEELAANDGVRSLTESARSLYLAVVYARCARYVGVNEPSLVVRPNGSLQLPSCCAPPDEADYRPVSKRAAIARTKQSRQVILARELELYLEGYRRPEDIALV